MEHVYHQPQTNVNRRDFTIYTHKCFTTQAHNAHTRHDSTSCFYYIILVQRIKFLSINDEKTLKKTCSWYHDWKNDKTYAINTRKILVRCTRFSWMMECVAYYSCALCVLCVSVFECVVSGTSVFIYACYCSMISVCIIPWLHCDVCFQFGWKSNKCKGWCIAFTPSRWFTAKFCFAWENLTLHCTN